MDTVEPSLTAELGYVQDSYHAVIKRNNSSRHDTLRTQSRFPQTQGRKSPEKLMRTPLLHSHNNTMLGKLYKVTFVYSLMFGKKSLTSELQKVTL